MAKTVKTKRPPVKASKPANAAKPRSTASRSTASRSTASRSTASRSTASRSTASRSTASRSDGRRNLSLRRALDRARAMLARRDLNSARRAIEKAGEQGPLAVRPTRLLWDVASRWLKARGEGEGGTLDVLFTSPDSGRHIDAGDAARTAGKPEKAIGHYEKALALTPLSPETIYKMGLACADEGDLTEASHWLRLVPDILTPERRGGPIARQWVSDSLLKLARVELARGHRSKAASLALKALDVRPDSPEARQFLWDLENRVG